MSKFELVILGSGGVGKSAITIQFIQGNFVEKYDPTIEDSYRKDMVVDGESCMLDILDTAGQEEYEGMRDEYMRSGQGFILVYSITDESSFHDLEDIHSKLLKAKDAEGDEVPVVLIGNKCDLEEERQVKDSQGKDMAKRFGRYTKFMEASARNRINIDEAFTEMIRLINRLDRGEPPEDEEKAAAEGGEGEQAGGDGAGDGGDGGDDNGGDGGDGSGGDKKDGEGSSSSGGKNNKKNKDDGSKKEDGGGGSSGSAKHGSSGGGLTKSASRKSRKKKSKTVMEVDPSEYINMMSALPAASRAIDASSSGEGKKSIICYDFDADKTENLSTSQISEIPDAQDWVAVRWVSMEGPLSKEDASAVVDRFQIHPVCTDDLLSNDAHPQLDVYSNCLHLTASLFVRPDNQSPVQSYPLNLFLFEHAIVTHLNGPAEALSSVKGQISDANSPVRKNGPSFLLYQILLALAESCAPVADTYRNQLDEIEREALSMPNTELLKQVYVLRRELLLLRKHINPMIEALSQLEQQCSSTGNDDVKLVDAETRPYITSVKNKFNKIVDVLSTYTDMCDSLTSIKTDAQQNGNKCIVM